MRKMMLTTALALCAAPVLADDAALLLGVERYQNLGRVSDAADMLRPAGALREAGYGVADATNPTMRDIRAALRDFVTEAADADRLVVALSGRFVTDSDRTWFLAADARRPALFDLPDYALSLESVFATLSRAQGQAIVVLGVDAADDDAIGAYLREGIGSLDPPQGVTVLVADPRYADDILPDAITVAGANVMEYVRDSRRITAFGYQPQTLVMQNGQAPAPQVATGPVIDPILGFWNDAQEANTADSYRDFLFRFADSPYAAEARRRLDRIENDPQRLAELAEAQLKLSRNDRRAVQRNLTLLNFDTRGVDGIFGRGSRAAIRNWQQNNGYAQTAYLDAEQINRLDAQASRRRAEIAAEEERARAEALRLDRAYWEETGARGDAPGFRAYLEKYPKGSFANEATAGLAALAPKPAPQAAAPQPDTANERARARERGMNVDPVLARLIESRLSQLGFNPGTVDGRFDRDTRGAIGRYQTARNLPATGYLSEPTLARLLADAFTR